MEARERYYLIRSTRDPPGPEGHPLGILLDTRWIPLTKSYALYRPESNRLCNISRWFRRGSTGNEIKSESNYSPCGGSSSHDSPKKSAAAILPGSCEPGGVFKSTIAQSGKTGICRALFRSAYSRKVKPLLTTT